MDLTIKNITEVFQTRFSAEPLFIRSPGRVNLIGEHTDYNSGFVLPAAIDKSIVLAIAPNTRNKIRLHAVDVDQGAFETEISGNYERSDSPWANYILGVVDELNKAGRTISGFDCAFGGNIPIGAGLSSSAALEGGVIYGLSKLFDLNLTPMQMTLLAQKAENRFVGVQCGIMDQFANLLGKENHVMKLDCRSLDYQYVPFANSSINIVLCDTNVRRELATSEYNVRRSQCEQAVGIMQKSMPFIQSLRDVSASLLETFKAELDQVVYKRCLYVIEENQRVLDACDDLRGNDMISFGKKMYQSHYGLRDQYEVSCKELDILVEATENLEGVLGSRMMGGGFGGCSINLVLQENMDQVLKELKKEYFEKTELELTTHTAKIGEGTHSFSLGNEVLDDK
ncbi:MAG: galactokinase [Balneolales bacterium]